MASRKRATYETLAWAIDLRLDGRPGFKGHAQPPIPIAVWTTRRDAREALRTYREEGGLWAREHYWNLARVVRVQVTIREVPGG